MAVAVVQAEDVAEHASKASCWVVIHGKVWDLTGETNIPSSSHTSRRA